MKFNEDRDSRWFELKYFGFNTRWILQHKKEIINGYVPLPRLCRPPALRWHSGFVGEHEHWELESGGVLQCNVSKNIIEMHGVRAVAKHYAGKKKAKK